MAGEIQTPFDQSGLTLYAQIRNIFGQIWNTASSAFQAYATANITDYDIALTEQGSASKYYTGNFPTAIPRGLYFVTVKIRAGASPAESDLLAGAGEYLWTGVALIPAGMAALLHRFYGKVTLTSSEEKTFDTDGSTVLVTQNVSDDGTTQTQGAGA